MWELLLLVINSRMGKGHKIGWDVYVTLTFLEFELLLWLLCIHFPSLFNSFFQLNRRFFDGYIWIFTLFSSILAAFRNPCLRIPRNLFPENEHGKRWRNWSWEELSTVIIYTVHSCLHLLSPYPNCPHWEWDMWCSKKSLGCAMDGYNAIGYEAEGWAFIGMCGWKFTCLLSLFLGLKLGLSWV